MIRKSRSTRVRQLARLAYDVAQIRWAQTGFAAGSEPGETPRNLMGFRDGTNNPSVNDAKAMDRFVWVGNEGPAWMRGGSYVVVRRIRIALEHWDRMKVAFQEETVGRQKYSGAPLGKHREFDPLDLDAADKDGNPIIPENSHVRLAAAASNDGARILRRPTPTMTASTSPPSAGRPGGRAWSTTPACSSSAISATRAPASSGSSRRCRSFDMMNQFVTHVGGGLFACPPGRRKASSSDSACSSPHEIREPTAP